LLKKRDGTARGEEIPPTPLAHGKKHLWECWNGLSGDSKKNKKQKNDRTDVKRARAAKNGEVYLERGREQAGQGREKVQLEFFNITQFMVHTL